MKESAGRIGRRWGQQVNGEVCGHIWEIGKGCIMGSFVGDVEEFMSYSKPNGTFGGF